MSSKEMCEKLAEISHICVEALHNREMENRLRELQDKYGLDEDRRSLVPAEEWEKVRLLYFEKAFQEVQKIINS